MTQKKRRISDDEYIIIPRWAITQLGLRGTELNVFGLIYSFSRNGDTLKGGLSFIAEWLGVGVNKTSEAISALICKGAINRTGEFRGAKTHYEYSAKKRMDYFRNGNVPETENIPEMGTSYSQNGNNNIPETGNSTIKRNIKEKYNRNIYNTQRACARGKKYRENVFLSSEEYSDLISRYGEDGTETMLDILSAHKLKTGAEYASDYGAILDWVIERYERRKQNEARRKNTPGREQRAAAEEEENLRAAMRLREINRSRFETTGA